FRASTEKRFWSATAAIVSFALIVGALVATRSRTSWLGAATAVSFLVYAVPQVRRIRLHRAALIVAASSVVLALRSQSPLSNRYIPAIKKLQVTFRGPSGPAGDRSAKERIEIWRLAFAKIAEKPLLGIGGGQFATALGRAKGWRFSAH